MICQLVNNRTLIWTNEYLPSNLPDTLSYPARNLWEFTYSWDRFQNELPVSRGEEKWICGVFNSLWNSMYSVPSVSFWAVPQGDPYTQFPMLSGMWPCEPGEDGSHQESVLGSKRSNDGSVLRGSLRSSLAPECPVGVLWHQTVNNMLLHILCLEEFGL